MSEIPSDIAASAAQAAHQAREASREQQAARSAPAVAAQRHIKSIDEAGAVVETGDEDVAVFADAEGSGSQGRENEPAEQEECPPESAPPSGITRDEKGRLRLDIEA